MTARCRPRSRRAALLAGFGVPSDERPTSIVTTAQRTGAAHAPAEDGGDVIPIEPGDLRLRESREGVAASVFAFDMLRRACAIADGNAFYGGYEPRRARRYDNSRRRGASTRQARCDDDLSLQYDGEADHAIMALNGLNIDADQLVAASFLGRTSTMLSAQSYAPSRDEALDGLVQTVLRLAAGTKDAATAVANLKDIEARLAAARAAIEG